MLPVLNLVQVLDGLAQGGPFFGCHHEVRVERAVRGGGLERSGSDVAFRPQSPQG